MTEIQTTFRDTVSRKFLELIESYMQRYRDGELTFGEMRHSIKAVYTVTMPFLIVEANGTISDIVAALDAEAELHVATRRMVMKLEDAAVDASQFGSY